MRPKFRVNQIVMILEGTGTMNGRRDSGRLTSVLEVIPEVWEFKPEGEKSQFSYILSFGPKLHESWLRALTGEEITGRI